MLINLLIIFRMFIFSFVHFINTFIHLLICSFNHSFIHSSFHSFILSFIHSFILLVVFFVVVFFNRMKNATFLTNSNVHIRIVIRVIHESIILNIMRRLFTA